MILFGVEILSFSCNRYVIVDTIITLVVVAVCVPVFVMVPPSRVYTGILLGLAVVFFLKLWRFLPSHRRWVERQARKKAEELVSEWCASRPPAQLPGTPTANTGVVEMSAVTTPAVTVMGVDGVLPLPQYGYPGRCPYYGPTPTSPYACPPVVAQPPPQLLHPPSHHLPLPPPLMTNSWRGTGEDDVWRQTPPAESPFRPSPLRSARSASPALSPPRWQSPPRPSSPAAMRGDDAQGRRVAAEESVWRSRESPSPTRHRHCSSRARMRGDVPHPTPLLPRSRPSWEPSCVPPTHSLPASYGPPAASARSASRHQHDHYLVSPTRSIAGGVQRQRSRHRGRRRHSSHRSQRSSASSYSVASSDMSGEPTVTSRGVHYSRRSRYSVAPPSARFHR